MSRQRFAVQQAILWHGLQTTGMYTSTLRDFFDIRCGLWEAKDLGDDLDAEIQKKIDKGYPLTNTIFEDTRQAVLYQGGQERYRFDLSDQKQLAALLNEFFAHVEPEIDNVYQAVDEFQTQVPELAKRLVEILPAARGRNDRAFTRVATR